MLVTLALIGTFAAYAGSAADHRHTYIVAARELRPGQQLTSADLTTVRLDLPRDGLARRSFVSIRALAGAVVVSPVAKGELIQASMVVASTDHPAIEVSIPIDPARSVGGTLRPGDRVDVASTVGTGADAVTTFVVRRAAVLSVDRPKGSLGPTAGDVITLAVASPTDALAVTHASSAGQINLVRVTGTGDAGPASAYSGPERATN